MTPPARRAPLPSRLSRRLVAGALLGVLVYAGIAAWADFPRVAEALSSLPLWVVPACCGLSFTNYAVRFWKWQRYLRLLSIPLERRTSFLIYLAGLSMSVTPGKMGEVFKSWLIKKVQGARIHHTAPIVVAERITDLLAYLILIAIGGLTTVAGYAWLFAATLALCALLIALVGSTSVSRLARRTLKSTPYLWRLAERVEGAFASARVLLAPREIALPTLVSVVGWGCECTGFWLLARALLPGSVPFLYAVFAFAASAVVGAVLIVFPGGLGITEFSLGKLLRHRYSAAGLALDVAQQKAAAVVIVARLCTLWFAVAVGLAALAAFTRRYGAVEEEEDT